MNKEIPLGWGEVVRRLSPVPVCTLIEAPHSTGKRTVAEYLSHISGVHSFDQLLVPESYWVDSRNRRVDVGSDSATKFIEPELSVEEVRRLSRWASTAAHTEAGKLVVIRLNYERSDGSTWRASNQCCTALLKLLEEPPAGVKFILLTSEPVLDTIVSRCVHVKSGLLSIENVAEVLYKVSDLDRIAAREAAVLGGGRVTPSLRLRASVGAREAVLGALTAIASGDEEALSLRAKEWTSEFTDLLLHALHEIVSSRYSFFSAEELRFISASQAMKLIFLLRTVRFARPRMVLGAASSSIGA